MNMFKNLILISAFLLIIPLARAVPTNCTGTNTEPCAYLNAGYCLADSCCRWDSTYADCMPRSCSSLSSSICSTCIGCTGRGPSTTSTSITSTSISTTTSTILCGRVGARCGTGYPSCCSGYYCSSITKTCTQSGGGGRYPIYALGVADLTLIAGVIAVVIIVIVFVVFKMMAKKV
jgi:hypothetical protein